MLLLKITRQVISNDISLVLKQTKIWWVPLWIISFPKFGHVFYWKLNRTWRISLILSLIRLLDCPFKALKLNPKQAGGGVWRHPLQFFLSYHSYFGHYHRGIFNEQKFERIFVKKKFYCKGLGTGWKTVLSIKKNLK